MKLKEEEILALVIIHYLEEQNASSDRGKAEKEYQIEKQERDTKLVSKLPEKQL